MLSVRKKKIGNLDRGEVEAWRLFQQQASYQNPFYSLSFAQAVDASGNEVYVSVIREYDEIVGFFPYHKKFPFLFPLLGEVDRLGGEMSDYFGILLKPNFSISPRKILAAAGLSRITFTHLPDILLSCGMHAQESRLGTKIILEKNGERYWRELTGKNRKFTADTERRERAVAKTFGPLSFSFQVVNALELDNLIKVKRQQYKRTGVSDALTQPWKINLLKRLHVVDNYDCSGKLSTLYAGETWVASHFGLFAHGILHYWFPVYNPGLQKFSPGRLLLRQFILNASQLGILEIDRGEGVNLAKRDFANYEHLFFRGEWRSGSINALLCKVVSRLFF